MKQFPKISFVIPLMISTVIIIFCYSAFSANNKSKENLPKIILLVNDPAVELKVSMRKLWEDHVAWTRNVILCLVDELPGKDQAIKRLLQNQIDIGTTFKPYYGEAMGNKLTQLLCTHINTSVEVVKAAKVGNAIALDEANKKWYENADQISEFLCKENPNWIITDMKIMMNVHLKLTTDEVTQRIKRNYDGDVIAYDKIRKEILAMADMFTMGITKQFPEKFETDIAKGMTK